MDIITISWPESGGKPTFYAAKLEDLGRETLRRHIKKGLSEGRLIVHLDDKEKEEVLDSLKERRFAWIDETLLVDITEVTEDGDADGEKE